MGVFVSLTTPAALAAFFSTALISSAPNILLFLLPDLAKQSSGTGALLTLGQSMAAGGLLGDVFLHTLESSSGDSGLWILAGYAVFFTVDLLIRALQDDHSSHAAGSEGGHGKERNSAPRSMVLLNVAADVLHNFTDGLAIGASYTTTNHVSFLDALASRGGVATLSVFLHEVPHEIGDYCTLVKAGYSRNQAVGVQFLTSIGAMLGTVTAVVASTQSWAEQRLSWITAGGFIYLASSTLLPEVLAEGGEGSHWRRMLFRLTQLAMFCLGVLSLYGVALLEDSGGESHSHHHHKQTYGHHGDNHRHHNHQRHSNSHSEL